ncbi:MAG: polysaccharide lyase [Synechococcales bacterium]|nr:polysaccharide lyase [Synechococcales bacterium]
MIRPPCQPPARYPLALALPLLLLAFLTECSFPTRSEAPPSTTGSPQTVPTSPEPQTTLPSAASRALLAFEDDFEDGIAEDWRRETCCDHSVNVVAAPQRSGQAARFEVRRQDPQVAGNTRSEIALRPEPPGEERWYRFSTFLPEDWQNDPAGDIIAQWHGAPDLDLGEGFTQGGPPLSLHVDGNQMYILSQWDPNPVTYRREPAPGKGSERIWQGRYSRGEWIEWVFRVRWSYEADGRLQVWRNGEQIVNRQGPNTYNDQRGVYFKIGIYKYSWKSSPERSTTQQRVIFADDIHISRTANRDDD